MLKALSLTVLIGYMIASVVSFIAYGIDKSSAQAGKPRISERTLLLLGLLGGWPGALLGQTLFRHKTMKTSFRYWFWLTVIANVSLLVGGLFLVFTLAQ